MTFSRSEPAKTCAASSPCERGAASARARRTYLIFHKPVVCRRPRAAHRLSACELIDRIAAGAPVRKLLVVEAFGPACHYLVAKGAPVARLAIQREKRKRHVGGHGASGLRASVARLKGHTSAGGAEIALLIVITPVPSQGSANPQVLRDNPVSRRKRSARTPRPATLIGGVVIGSLDHTQHPGQTDGRSRRIAAK